MELEAEVAETEGQADPADEPGEEELEEERRLFYVALTRARKEVIITYAKENIDVKQGDELGFIKFGSRVDVFLPIGTEVEIPILQQVKANKSIIAKI